MGRLEQGVRAASSAAAERIGRLRAYLMAQPPYKRIGLPLLWCLGAPLALLLVWVLILLPFTPGVSDLKQTRAAKASVLMSADGKELASFEEGVQERVTLAQISPHMIAALIATEDHRFRDHHGIDFRRTFASVLHTALGDPQGGSTISQQLARNLYPEQVGRARNINRKLKEMITAVKIESAYSKDEILESYLNTVPFLYNTFGIEMAARTYFDTTAAKLDVLQSATLVGMLKGTNYYNPVTNPERSVQRRNVVLSQMRKHGMLDEKRYDSLRKKPLRVSFSRQAERKPSDTHFTAYVRKWLIEWADENDYNVERDGLVVHTTLDSAMQEAAEKAVERQGNTLQIIADVEWAQSDSGYGSAGGYAGMHGSITPFEYFWRAKGTLVNAFIRETPEYRKAVESGDSGAQALKRLKADRAFIARLRAAKTRLETGFVAMDPENGHIKAWVGSRDFHKEQYDHVVQAARQPGSTFKPIVYGAALEKGFAPNRPYRDAVMNIKAGDGTVWRPTDMSGSSGNQMSMRDGLVFSKNTITAQVMQDVGLPGIIDLARGLGIRNSKLESVPSLALGTSPVTLLEMVNAYSSIAAQGEYRKPVFVTRITDRAGNVLAEFGNPAPERAMSSQNAADLIDMMRGVINRGTGTAIRYRFGINADVAGKTGTTQNNADGWFIMMHPKLVAGAWVGFNDNRVTMRSNYWGQGGHNAILVVGDFFKAAIAGGKVDTAALFPGGRRPEPVRQEEDPGEEISEEAGDMQQEGVAPPAPPEPDPEDLDSEDMAPLEGERAEAPAPPEPEQNAAPAPLDQ
ncbi:penicillin-binding protein [Massilia atriviolacea]|uniref:Penicillin-binding protein n=2 Tax=Massilia atriviolacea TaxID=2495579 RepID=A0A430HST9_9BURK|nr:penicillin-binding protein [Massilia atriviolacea]